MATLTRLASTLTAKYFPSQNLTDAFYIDGRLFGKRETRQADITIDKTERGFFLSVFAHPTIPAYEPGMMPPYEPQLRNTCNEVKFGRKEIDGMIEGFLSTAVDVTGKMKLVDGEERTPYFSGVIVRDAEAFAVTIGSGLAFLYRDDTLFPLTDAGIPMEPIDTNGNRVADFLYYCSSKTANALWSNYFTLSPDDCIILCNKEVYDALGQRELLRILADADDQCDAAGVVITQASARMPNVPMQFSISFVESVASDEKKGLFGFKRKNKNEEDTSDMSIESSFEGGVVGAAAEAAADAGFVSGLPMTDAPAEEGSSILFGDNAPGAVAPSSNQEASSDKGIEVSDVETKANPLEFLDTSVSTEPIVEMSADEMFKNLFGDAAATTAGAAAGVAAAGAASEAVASEATAEASVDVASKIAEVAVNPFAISSDDEVKMEPISTTEVDIKEDEKDQTKAGSGFDMDFLKSLEYSLKKDKEAEVTPLENKENEESSDDLIKSAVSEFTKIETEEAKVEEKPEESAESAPEASDTTVTNDSEIVFGKTDGFIDLTPEVQETNTKADFGAAFDPYSAGDSDEMQNTAPFVFGDDLASDDTNKEDEPMDEKNEIPVPEFAPDFDMTSEKPSLKEEDKLAIDFPVADEAPVEEAPEQSDNNGFELPFENAVNTFEDDPAKTAGNNDIPDMPLYESNSYDTPVNAVSSEAPVNMENENVYLYGQYVENENMAEGPQPELPIAEQVYGSYEDQIPPYQPVSNEGQVYASEADSYQYQPGQFQDQAYQQEQQYQDTATEEAAPSGDDDWINALLGIGGAEDVSYNSAASTGNTDMYNDYSSSTQAASKPQAASGANRNPQTYPLKSGSNGNGGRGNAKKTLKLNRNGYMFLAFVIVCLVCLIILISAIVKSCGRNDEVTDPTEDTSVTETEQTELTEFTEAAPADPSAPIGMFTFSDFIGYRTWWDLFNQVYGINDIANESDPRIATIITYNNLDSTSYTPHSGDSLLLPPIGVIEGTIPVTFQVGTAASSGDATTGDIQVVDGSTDEATGEEVVADGAEEVAEGDAAGEEVVAEA